MDTELLKTFVELHRTGHFGKAAENLHVTQAAVSARIKQLEDKLGTKLFLRNRNNLTLSAEGERLLQHAETILTAWTRAVQDVALADEAKNQLSISATSGIWHFVLASRLLGISQMLSDTVIRADVGSDTELYQQVQSALIDIAILYESARSTALVATPLGKLKLVLVGTRKDASIKNVFSGKYVFVDWGTRFKVFHARKFGLLSWQNPLR
ncbi:MAG: LysR family transcriptional regulator [Gammaproteobacteria bacterium]|nr:LysR family transcriptional regulator [Gammaproteobacteria bacterium]